MHCCAMMEASIGHSRDAYKSSGFFFYLSPLLGLSVHVLGQWKRMCSFKERCIFL